MTTNTYTNGMTRRNFLYASGAAALATAVGCAGGKEMTKEQEEQHDILINNLVGDFVDKSLDNLQTGDKTVTPPDVLWTNYENKGLSPQEVNDGNYLSTIAKLSAKVAKGQSLLFHQTMYNVYKAIPGVEKAISKDTKYQEAFLNDFGAALVDSQRNLLNDTDSAQGELTNKLYSEYNARSAGIRKFRENGKAYSAVNATLGAQISATIDAYDKNAALIQESTRARIIAKVPKCDYEGMTSLIELDDLLEQSRGRESFKDQGRSVASTIDVLVDGKLMRLQDYQNERVNDAVAHARARDANWEHDIIWDDRSPVAEQIFILYGSKEPGRKLNTSRVQGALHHLDLSLANAYTKTAPEGGNVLKWLWNLLPLATAPRFVENVIAASKERIPKGMLKQVFRSNSKAYVGFPSVYGSNKENPLLGAVEDGAILIVDGLLIWGGYKLATRKSHGGGSGNKGVSGGETQQPGVTPQ
jgi:hypothetical protein